MSQEIGKVVAVFGATGGLGREVVYQALKSGKKVVAFVRDPTRLTIPEGSGDEDAGKPIEAEPEKLVVVTGDVKISGDVDKLFANSPDIDSVIICLGGRTSNVGATMLTEGTTNIITSMKKFTKALRISVVTSIGVGDSASYAPWTFKLLMWTVMARIMADKNNQEQLFLDPSGIGHDLEYFIVRPGGLGSGKPTGVIVAGNEGGTIQRSDVASYLLRSVSEVDFPLLRKSPCISSNEGTGWEKQEGASADGGPI